MLLDPDKIQDGVKNGPLGSKVSVFRQTASTNDLVLRLAEDGAQEGVVVFAEHQTAGRGQFHRAWHSADGAGLWFSVLLRRDIPASNVTILTQLSAVAVLDGIATAVDGCSLRIKPHNDVLGRMGKVAGILIEARTGRNPFAVVGIGINVNQREEDFPEELRDIASSVALETCRFQDRTEIACSVLRKMNECLNELNEETPSFVARYKALARQEVSA